VLGVEVIDNPDMVTAGTVVTNRPLLPAIADQIEAWKVEGRRVICDIDDAFDWLPPNHGIAGRFTTDHLHRAFKAADVVTCSTPALADLYGYGHGVVARNCVPASLIGTSRVGHGERQPWVGWVGSLAAHPDDLNECGDGPARALQATGAAFAFVGPTEDSGKLREALGWPEQGPAFVSLGMVSLRTLPRVLVELDAGIVPLAACRFSTAKSALKGLEYAACGVPGVASPSPEYRRMARQDGCLLANSPGEWFRHLHRLLDMPSYRAERIAAGLEFARQRTYENQAHVWRDVWFA
jgi:glycosyltransferase involved in cell wall biosynthesis